MNNDNTPSEGSDNNGSTPAEVDSQPSVPAETPVVEQTAGEEGSSKEESFFDPNSVPEELKPAYKQMQAAFTKKTQEIAETRKQAEALRTKAEQLDKYQPYLPIVEEMLKNQQRSTQSSPELIALEEQYRKAGYSEEAIEMMKMGIGFALNHVNQKMSTEKQAATLETRVNEAESVDPRLNDQSLVYTKADGTTTTFGEVVASLVKADPIWTQDPVAATKRAIASVDALIGNAKTQGKTELSASAQAKAKKFPSLDSSPQSAEDSSQPVDMHAAAQKAMKQLGVKF